MSNRVVLGDLGSGTYGLKVSKPGFNALTAADSDLLFTTNRATLRILAVGTVTLANGASTTITLSTLGATPLFLFAQAETTNTAIGNPIKAIHAEISGNNLILYEANQLDTNGATARYAVWGY